MTDSEKIYIVDRITSKPGRGRTFLELYMQRYAPGARERGMTHEFTLVAPPLWMTDRPNTLYIIWSVVGVAQWWEMARRSRYADAVTEWWADAQSMIDSRDRHYASDIADLAVLSDV